MNFKIFGSDFRVESEVDRLEKEVNDFLDEHEAEVIHMNTIVKGSLMIITLIYKVR